MQSKDFPGLALGWAFYFLPGLSLKAPPPQVGGKRWWGPVLSRQEGRE